MPKSITVLVIPNTKKETKNTGIITSSSRSNWAAFLLVSPEK